MTNQTFKESRLTVIGVLLTLTAFAISANVIPPLITTISKETGVDYNNFGFIIMFQYFSFFIAGIVGGWVSGRYGIDSKTFVIIGLSITSITLTAGFFLKNMVWFNFWVIPLGVGGGLIEAFGSVMISNYEKPTSSKLLNLSQIFYCIGAIIAPSIIVLLLHLKISWQIIFLFFGALISLILFIFLSLVPQSLTVSLKFLPAAKKSDIPLVKDPMFYLLSVIIFLYVAFESMLACWIAVYFEEQLFCSVYNAALRISIFWSGVILGRLIIMVIPQKFTLWPAMFAGVLLMCFCSLIASFIENPTHATFLLFCVGFGAGPIWPTTVAICHAVRNRTRFTSSVIAIGAIGVVVGSWLGAFIFRYMDFGSFFPLIAIGTGVLFAVILLSYKKYNQEKRDDLLLCKIRCR